MMLTAERRRAYEIESAPIDREAAQAMLEERLFLQLQGQIGPDGQVLHTNCTAQVTEGRLYVSLTAECREEIGREVPSSRPIPGDAPLE